MEERRMTSILKIEREDIIREVFWPRTNNTKLLRLQPRREQRKRSYPCMQEECEREPVERKHESSMERRTGHQASSLEGE
jgi:hypothetical protein